MKKTLGIVFAMLMLTAFVFAGSKDISQTDFYGQKFTANESKTFNINNTHSIVKGIELTSNVNKSGVSLTVRNVSSLGTIKKPAGNLANFEVILMGLPKSNIKSEKITFNSINDVELLGYNSGNWSPISFKKNGNLYSADVAGFSSFAIVKATPISTSAISNNLSGYRNKTVQSGGGEGTPEEIEGTCSADGCDKIKGINVSVDISVAKEKPKTSTAFRVFGGFIVVGALVLIFLALKKKSDDDDEPEEVIDADKKE